MAEQFTSARIDTLEQAIQAIVHDDRVPKALRTALEAYQERRVELNKAEHRRMLSGWTEITYLPNMTHSRDAGPYPCSSPTESTVVEQALWVHMHYNRQSHDWSVTINGHLHEHVTSEVVEALVECAMICAETSLMEAIPQRLQ
jgi:uncharacterized protein (UPF0147 family)